MATQSMKHRGQAAGLLGVVALFSALFALLLTRSLTDPYVVVQGLIGLIGIGIYLATNLGEMGDQFTGRGSFYNVITAVFGVVLVAALVGVNYIAVKKPKQWDLTQDKIYTLSDQTRSTLQGLKEEVKLRAFFSPLDREYKELEDRVRQYKQYSDKLTLEFLDPSSHPREVAESNITIGGPRILVKVGAKEARAKDSSEEALTNAIAEVTRGGAKKIYFTKGHGESSPADATNSGLKAYVSHLKAEGFLTDEILLAAVKELPKDAQVIAVAGPAAAFLDSEIKLLRDYVDKGGKLVALINPGAKTGLEKLAAEWGITLGDDEVIDPSSQEFEVAIAQTYAEHPITKRHTERKMFMAMPLSRSASKSKAPPAGWTQTELAKTGASAWGETEMKAGPLKYDAGKDTPGPVSLAVAATKGSGETESRVVVVGNRDFALNAISWAAKEESKISIRPPRRQGNLLFLSADQKKGMFLFALNVLPFALLAAGLLVWQSRKSR